MPFLPKTALIVVVMLIALASSAVIYNPELTPTQNAAVLDDPGIFE